MTLHYNFESSPDDREFTLTPLAIEDNELSIAAVLHEEQSFANYDPLARALTLPAGTGGHFEVTFERVGAQAGIRGDVNQDQVVNIFDVLRTVNILLEVGDPPSQYEIWASDCNNDETVNIVDALGIVNVVLGIGECIPGACKTELTPHVLEFLKSLELYLSAEHFDKLMAMVKQIRVPAEYYLSQNYPNPFNPETEINYALPADGMVTLEVYNLLGQRVATLIDEIQAAGTYTVTWNAAEMPSGTYFYRITVNEFTATNTMILMK